MMATAAPAPWIVNRGMVVPVPEIHRIAGETADGSMDYSKFFYCRSQSIRFAEGMNRLVAIPFNKHKPKCPLLIGLPGSGKTLLTWAWVWQRFRVNHESVLIVFIGRAGVDCLFLDASATEPALFDLTGGKTLSADDLCETMEQLGLRPDILLMDGVTHANFGDWLSLTTRIPAKLHIMSSSVGALPQNQDKQDVHIPLFWYSSWTRDEYAQVLAAADGLFPELLTHFTNAARFDSSVALEDDEKPDPASLEDCIDFMLDWAGGSARWMFEYSCRDIEMEVNTLIAQVENIDVIYNSQSGILAPKLVHGLFQQFWGRGAEQLTLVSRFVSRAIAAKFPNPKDWTNYSLADIAAQLWKTGELLGNRAIQGYALELEYFAKIQQYQPLQLRLRSLEGPSVPDSETLQGTLVREFTGKLSLSSIVLSAADLDAGVWLKPRNINHGCYDFAFCKAMSDFGMIPRKIIRIWTLQVTVSSSHSRKLAFLRDLLKWATSKNRCEHVELWHVACVEPKNFAQFAFQAPVGTVNDYLQQRVLESYRTLVAHLR